jgi:hypothetical protein
VFIQQQTLTLRAVVSSFTVCVLRGGVFSLLAVVTCLVV